MFAIGICSLLLSIFFFSYQGLKKKKIESKNNPEVVYRIFKNKLYDVKKGIMGKPLPDKLIINPDYYSWRGSVYNLNFEGVYRFVKVNEYQEQHIVYKSNLYNLLSSLAVIHTHGKAHDFLDIDELTLKAIKNKLSLTCGHISLWLKNILKSLGIKVRLVAVLTLDKWNSFDNGHTMIEVYDRILKKWVLFDIDNNVYFVDQKKAPLSLLEFKKHVRNNNYNLFPLAFDSAYDNTMNSFLIEKTLFDLKRWYRRVAQVIMIFDEEHGKYLYFDFKNKKRISSYSYNYYFVTYDRFIEKFYSSSTQSD